MYLPPFAKKISQNAHILFKLPHPFQNSFISYLHSFWEYRSDLLVLRRIYIPCKGFRQLCHKTGLFLFMRFCSRRPTQVPQPTFGSCFQKQVGRGTWVGFHQPRVKMVGARTRRAANWCSLHPLPATPPPTGSSSGGTVEI